MEQVTATELQDLLEMKRILQRIVGSPEDELRSENAALRKEIEILTAAVAHARESTEWHRKRAVALQAKNETLRMELADADFEDRVRQGEDDRYTRETLGSE